MTRAVPVSAPQHVRNEGLRLGVKTTPLALAAGLLLAAGLAPQGAWAQASETRVQAFSYHPTTALLTQQVNEPDTAAIALTTDYTYDGFGNQLSATVSGPDIASRATSATYTPDGRFLETATNALTHSETHATDARFGTVTSLTGPNLLATTWVYDGFGRKTTETRADGTETRWTYELCVAQCPTGGVYLVTAQDFDSGGTASSAKAIQYLDTLNRVFRSETEGFDGTPVYVDTEFTARGEVHRVSKPYFQGTPAQDILWTTYAYDVLGRVTSVTLPDGGVESTAYDGLTTTLTNALTQTSVRVENALGELVSATDNLSNVTTYAYDPFGNLTETNAAGVVTTMTYDVRGLKLTMDDPDMGDWSYDYNALGESISQTDAKGQVTTMAYDVLGRMTARTDAFGTVDAVTITWTYDTATKGIGKIASVSAPHDSYAEAMTYDSLGRPSTASVTIDGTAYDTSTLYDTAGRADTLVYPTGFTVRSSFTPRGHLSQVTDDLGSTVYWQADTVNAEGQVTAETLGNGVTTARVYDTATSRIDSILTTKAAVTIQDLGFDFDTLGNLTERRDLRQDRAEALTYDGLNRLKSTTLTDTATLQTLGTPVTYTYDALGNITNKSDVGAYTYGTGAPGQPGPHAVVTAGGSSYTYDANGSMVSGAGKTTTWTPFNKPKLIVASPNDETFFVYGPSRARFKQNIKKGGLITNMIYVGSHFEKKTRLGEDDELVHYIRAGTTVAIYTEYRDAQDTVTGSKTRYLHRDHLGSVESVTDEAGAATEYLSYDPHGKRRLTDWQAGTPVAAVETPRGFTGHEHLDAVGLIHMNGRVYDPTLGRFLSADPFVTYPETTQGFNRYSYTDNNPLSYTDPSGFGYKDERDFRGGSAKKGKSTGRSSRDYGKTGWEMAKERRKAEFHQAAKEYWKNPGLSWRGALGQVRGNGFQTASKQLADHWWRIEDGIWKSTSGITFDARTRQRIGYDVMEDAFANREVDPVTGEVTYTRNPEVVRASYALEVALIDPQNYAKAHGIPAAFDYYNNPNIDSIRNAAAMQAANKCQCKVAGRVPYEDMAYVGLSAAGIAVTAATRSFYRGAAKGQVPDFKAASREYRVDPTTGYVKDSHGVSVFDNPTSVRQKGFEPHEIDLNSIPAELQVKQRGLDPRHYEIRPRPGTKLTPEQYQEKLDCIQCF
ncbi:RHS repeat-associated core domain-containing protein [Pelagibius sp.]|uniref:RHS repeat-associated core domain-containing protein n=1 Tax=Pelagibius sp. TaxID=1931238 RepID=UPI00262D7D99|nr:RHS repeat-associated core domain-containing protein [Pelagibius sp.]